MKLANFAAVACLVVCGATAASAGDQPYRAPAGIYVEAGGGAGWYPSTTWTFKTGAPADHHNTFDSGEMFRLAVGTQLGYGFRGEIEGSIRSNGADRTVAGGSPFDLTGQVRSQAVMANAIYDFKMGSYRGITPFVGAGIGWSHLDVSTIFVVGGNQALGSDDRFAWQLMAGVAVPLGDTMSLTARYTYFDTVGDRMTVNNLGVSRPIDIPYNNHSVTVGLRIGF
jgi:opacity protein-like surface antigen